MACNSSLTYKRSNNIVGQIMLQGLGARIKIDPSSEKMLNKKMFNKNIAKTSAEEQESKANSKR